MMTILMNNKKLSTVFFLLSMVAVFGAVACDKKDKKVYGTIHCSVDTTDQEEVLTKSIDQVQKRLKHRVGDSKVTKGVGSIRIEVPGLRESELEKLIPLLEMGGKVEFKIVDNSGGLKKNEVAPIMGALYWRVVDSKDERAAELGISGGISNWTNPTTGVYSNLYLRAEDGIALIDENEYRTHFLDNKSCTKEGSRYQCTLNGREKLETYVREVAATNPEFQVDSEHEFGYEFIDYRRNSYWRSYYLLRKTEITNAGLEKSSVDISPYSGRPEVRIKFTGVGGKRFAKLTRANVGRKVAMILDGRILSAPTLETPIEGGRSVISFEGESLIKVERDANDLSTVINTGSPSVPLRCRVETPLPPRNEVIAD